MIRILLLLITVTGSLLFASAFVLSYTNPVMVENMAREVVRLEVEKRVKQNLHTLEESKITAFASRLAGQQAAEIEKIRQQLAAGLPAKIAGIMAEMGKLDCPCRQKIEKTITTGLEERSLKLANLNNKLNNLIRSKYMDVAEALTREFRIFTSANALVFILLAASVIFRPRASVQLLLPAGVLLGAAAVTGFFYLFRQDWLHTIVFADYLGLAYFSYLGLAIASLADIAFNKARVCSAAINGIAHVIGAPFHVLPC
ncbi:hypothetical protein [Undibacterium pigrum]|uniref:Uncharacterized protein n=1 Tax=Undibacterium pigrum TaxID=401470 RepID=A0A318J8Y6_9BURK|nr:hypothetical protein [Undibacterium pigrum]PXX44150.1 hypothetical protein DFR42_103419 [Undibacterium pigrum]